MKKKILVPIFLSSIFSWSNSVIAQDWTKCPSNRPALRQYKRETISAALLDNPLDNSTYWVSDDEIRKTKEDIRERGSMGQSYQPWVMVRVDPSRLQVCKDISDPDMVGGGAVKCGDLIYSGYKVKSKANNNYYRFTEILGYNIGYRFQHTDVIKRAPTSKGGLSFRCPPKNKSYCGNPLATLSTYSWRFPNKCVNGGKTCYTQNIYQYFYESEYTDKILVKQFDSRNMKECPVGEDALF